MSTVLEDHKINLVLDVKVQLTVRLGSCQLSMLEVLELTPGTVIQLKQRTSDPVELYVNDKLIAFGEVVVVEENFGIKVTQLVGETE